MANSPAKQPIPPRLKFQDLPVGFDAQGNAVSLRDYTDDPGRAVPIDSLDLNHLVELTALRIEKKEYFEFATITTGTVPRERAIDEVRQQTRLGQLLMEIEVRVIRQLL